MMKYDFNTVENRRNTDSIKWKVKENELPLWIADMDFRTAPCISKALEERVSTGIYGYTEPDEDWYLAYQNYYRDRYHVTLEKDWMIFALGVVPIISSTVRKLTQIGDNVVVLSPVYNIFYNSIINNARNVLEVELLKDGDEYSINWAKLEEAFSMEKTSLIIFCNPANPIGKIWSKEELVRLGDLAEKYHVTVLSDEIHAFLTRPGKEYIPFFSASETCRNVSVNAVSVTKPFNLAGIHTALCFVPDTEKRKKVNRQLNTDEVAEPNIFSCPSAVAALNEGREWLEELRIVLFRNRDYVRDFVKDQIPSLHVLEGDATYLLWIDVSKLGSKSKDFADYLRKETGLYLSDGATYGKGGNGFLRMNVACPMATLEDALHRLKKGTESYLQKR